MSDVASRLRPRVIVDPSPNAGRGLSAGARIEDAGEVVARLTGRIVIDDGFHALNLVVHRALAADECPWMRIADDGPTTCGNRSCDTRL